MRQLKEMEEVGKIYGMKSANYGLVFDPSNRETDKKQIDKIVKAMATGETIDPILVDSKTKVIIDGQHRYRAACRLWDAAQEFTLPVILREYKDRDAVIHGMMVCNNGRKNWGTLQFLQCWAKEGNEDYKTLLNLFNENKEYLSTKYKALITILALNGGYNKYREGDFKIGDYDRNLHLLDELKFISDAMSSRNIFKPTLITYYNYKLNEYMMNHTLEDRDIVLQNAQASLKEVIVPPDELSEWKKIFNDCNIFPENS